MVFSLLVIIVLIMVAFAIYIFIFNKRIKEDLLNILRLNSRNYLKVFVGMANKKDFKLNNIVDLVKIKFNKLYKDYNKIYDNNYVLEKAIDILEYGILILDNDKNIYYINNQMQKLFDINDIKKLHGENIKNTRFKWILDFNNKDVFEIPKEYSQISISCYMQDINNELKIYTFKNITDKKKLDAMSTEFISNITHELKTPLTSIMGFAETLRDVENEEDRQMFYDIISKEAIRLNNLISDILIFSEIETQNDICKQKVDIIKVLYSIKQLLIPQIEKNNFNIKIIGDNISVLSCEKYIRQIFLNIIDNSIKHSCGQNLIITCSDDEKNVYVKFCDDGIGIPDDELPNIFDRFYKVSKYKSKSRGTGLGLSIVRSSIEKIDGDLKVYNNSDCGISFNISIPKNKVE